jgi:5,6-dimethylbenzimidazole synthase
MPPEISTEAADAECPLFETKSFADAFLDLLRWRRDVRRFCAKPVPYALIEDVLMQASLAPSVGLSQPWRFVLVEDERRRDAVRRDFAVCNEVAASSYADAQAALYRSLKLEGLNEAPVHIAVCCDHGATRGSGLGRKTQPQTLRDSVVCAIQILWLAARIHGLGVGWVSILTPQTIHSELDLPVEWELVAYLLLGWPSRTSDEPELAKVGWETRAEFKSLVITR